MKYNIIQYSLRCLFCCCFYPRPTLTFSVDRLLLSVSDFGGVCTVVSGIVHNQFVMVMLSYVTA